MHSYIYIFVLSFYHFVTCLEMFALDLDSAVCKTSTQTANSNSNSNSTTSRTVSLDDDSSHSTTHVHTHCCIRSRNANTSYSQPRQSWQNDQRGPGSALSLATATATATPMQLRDAFNNAELADIKLVLYDNTVLYLHRILMWSTCSNLRSNPAVQGLLFKAAENKRQSDSGIQTGTSINSSIKVQDLLLLMPTFSSTSKDCVTSITGNECHIAFWSLVYGADVTEMLTKSPHIIMPVLRLAELFAAQNVYEAVTQFLAAFFQMPVAIEHILDIAQPVDWLVYEITRLSGFGSIPATATARATRGSDSGSGPPPLTIQSLPDSMMHQIALLLSCIAGRFAELSLSQLRNLPLPLFVCLLQHPVLNVTTELQVLFAINMYLERLPGANIRKADGTIGKHIPSWCKDYQNYRRAMDTLPIPASGIAARSSQQTTVPAATQSGTTRDRAVVVAPVTITMLPKPLRARMVTFADMASDIVANARELVSRFLLGHVDYAALVLETPIEVVQLYVVHHKSGNLLCDLWTEHWHLPSDVLTYVPTVAFRACGQLARRSTSRSYTRHESDHAKSDPDPLSLHVRRIRTIKFDVNTTRFRGNHQLCYRHDFVAHGMKWESLLFPICSDRNDSGSQLDSGSGTGSLVLDRSVLMVIRLIQTQSSLTEYERLCRQLCESPRFKFHLQVNWTDQSNASYVASFTERVTFNRFQSSCSVHIFDYSSLQGVHLKKLSMTIRTRQCCTRATMLARKAAMAQVAAATMALRQVLDSF
jgi:hypothetical protein